MITKDKLLSSTQKLFPPSEKAGEEFSRNFDTFVAIGNKKIAVRSDLYTLIDPENHEMTENNNSNSARLMESIFVEYDRATLIETVLLVLMAYRSHCYH